MVAAASLNGAAQIVQTQALNIKKATDVHCLNSKIKKIFQKVIKPFIKIYNFVYAKNPVTLKKEFWFIPLSFEKFSGYWMYSSYIFNEGGKTFDENNAKVAKKVGIDLSKYAKRNFNWEFTQIRSSKINAFCLPGGKIAIYDGLIKGIDKVNIKGYEDVTKEDKIAAVLAHEIIHADARHAARKIEKLFLLNIIFIGLRVYLAITKSLQIKKNDKEENSKSDMSEIIINYFMKIFVKLYLFAGSRSQEYEADRYGMYLMKEAGYNPKAALWLQEFFSAREIKRSDWMQKIYEFFSTHPNAQNRLEKNKKTLKEIEKTDLASRR